jgi:phenylacetate-coenzyme A ligase PaaK-like adenylate-forming protein
MKTYEDSRQHILYNLRTLQSDNFEELALEVFRFQIEFNPLYSKYLNLLGIESENVKSSRQIPFLPIQFFRNHNIITGKWEEEFIFSSSGTTGQTTSRHFVRNIGYYFQNAEAGFHAAYGPLESFRIFALLPSYLEREGSSLVAMADYFIRKSNHSESGFFLDDLNKLATFLKDTSRTEIMKTILLGVSFALLNLAEQHPMDLRHCIIMETGGMKGRRKEITREELHTILKNAFKVDVIHSEYGMTELFSQAWSKGEGLFIPSPTMKVLAREITDPFAFADFGKTGVLNVIDLANVDTCSFIATDDLCKVYADGSFEVLGRLDESDVRGCNLLVQDRSIV